MSIRKRRIRKIFIALAAVSLLGLSGCASVYNHGAKLQYAGIEKNLYKTEVIYAEDGTTSAADKVVRQIRENLVKRNLIKPTDNVVVSGMKASFAGHGLRWVLVTDKDLVLKTGDIVTNYRPSDSFSEMEEAKVKTLFDLNSTSQFGKLVALVCRAEDKACVKKNNKFGAILENGEVTNGKDCPTSLTCF